MDHQLGDLRRNHERGGSWRQGLLVFQTQSRAWGRLTFQAWQRSVWRVPSRWASPTLSCHRTGSLRHRLQGPTPCRPGRCENPWCMPLWYVVRGKRPWAGKRRRPCDGCHAHYNSPSRRGEPELGKSCYVEMLDSTLWVLFGPLRVPSIVVPVGRKERNLPGVRQALR